MRNKVVFIEPENKIYKEIYIADGYISGFKLIDKDIYNLSLSEISSIWNIFSPQRMPLIDKWFDYDVYYDEENGLKHYIRNGIEDYRLFLEKNGTSIYEYKETNSQPNDKKTLKNLKEKYKIKIKKGIIIIDVLNIILGSITLGQYFYHSYKHPNYNPNLSFFSSNDLDSVTDISQVKEYIFSSNGLTDDQKSFLYNEKLFNILLPYYKNTTMERLLASRLDDVSIVYFDEFNNEVRSECIGYYCGDNKLHIKNGYEAKALGHEMIHLLENPLCTMKIFNEGMADIVGDEFYDDTNYGYPTLVKNLKLLINTIGPETVWNYTFNGDFTPIDEILKSNLNEIDYKRIIEVLSEPKFDDNLDAILQDLIFSLYRNIYGEEITSNRDIFDVNGQIINGIYFNEEKMPSHYEVTYPLFYLPESMIEYINVPIIKISKEKALQLKNAGYLIKTRVVSNNNYVSNILIAMDSTTREQVVSFNYDATQIVLPMEEAISKGYIKREYELIVDKKAKRDLHYDIPDNCNYVKYPILKHFNYSLSISDDGESYEFTIYSKNIRERFPNQKISKSDSIIL